jgi:hypothetical protein
MIIRDLEFANSIRALSRRGLGADVECHEDVSAWRSCRRSRADGVRRARTLAFLAGTTYEPLHRRKVLVQRCRRRPSGSPMFTANVALGGRGVVRLEDLEYT